MEALLAEKLSQYCDTLLSGSPRPIKDKKAKKEVKINNATTCKEEPGNYAPKAPTKNKKRKKTKASISQSNGNSPKAAKLEPTCADIGNDNVSNEIISVPRATGKVTDDGFKIVSFIPDDDSDVSDAFESDLDENNWTPTMNKKNKRNASAETSTNKQSTSGNNSNKSKMNTDLTKFTKDKVSIVNGDIVTDDGFKVVTEIPPDDDDVDDAFSDCEDNGFLTSDEVKAKKEGLSAKQALKKPLLKIMDDFGIDEIPTKEEKPPTQIKTKVSKKLKHSLEAQLTKAAQQKGVEEVEVLDVSRKRGLEQRKLGNVKKFNKAKALKEKKLKRLAKGKSQAQIEKENAAAEKEFKKVRYSVYKFGIGGFKKEDKQEAKIALAIKLGAKPPKNKATKYKDLLIQRKQEKKRELEARMEKRQMGLKVHKKQASRKRDPNGVTGFSGQVGRERSGVRVISRKEIDRINKS